MATILLPVEDRVGRQATCEPDQPRGKWHRVGYDDTVCGRLVGGNADRLPAEQVDSKDLCWHCWSLNRYGVLR